MTDTTKAPKPPAHLTAETRRFWEGLVNEYALEPPHLRTLEAACQSWDRYQQAREILR